MVQDTALRLALELYHIPSRVRAARAEPLPFGVVEVLSIAAGEEQAQREAEAQLARPGAVIRQACAFFIEQVLLSPECDSYRVLGATQQATTAELRRNMALLLRWFHPDHDPGGERSMFAGRVLNAWEDLKTPDRRHAYDAALTARPASSSRAVSTSGAPASSRAGSPSATGSPVGNGAQSASAGRSHSGPGSQYGTEGRHGLHANRGGRRVMVHCIAAERPNFLQRMLAFLRGEKP